ncbi:MAG: UDP-N-acetylmuramoyl-L-alanine--D-glutamate ligase [Clostridia bacterium]|nr:UDP-N-acetylmuramoyl-L-alanine--D-glutamate ligase [Clostridia bacterium]
MEHFERFKNDISGKTVGVVGCGVSNMPIITMLAEMGVQVYAFDKRTAEQMGEAYATLNRLGVQFFGGEDYMEHLCGDWIIKTPGMRFDHPALEKARQKGSVITSEMELFFAYCPCKIVAVTGSDGKTTTTSLIYEMLKRTARKVHLGGNIGFPLFCRLREIRPEDLVVAELSSFQLHTLRKSAQISVVTNLTPNHLDVHKGMEEYTEAKANIFRYQTAEDLLILNADNDVTAGFASEAKGRVRMFSFRKEPDREGAFYKDGVLYSRNADGTSEPILHRSELLLRGDHNVENFMAAYLAVKELVPLSVVKEVAETFGGVRHRMEFIRAVRGVKFYNDSIGSSPTRTIATLRSFDEKVRLIAGGYDKKIPYDALGPVVPERVEKLYLCGATAEKIRAAVAESAPDFPMEVYPDLRTAIEAAYRESVMGDTVLLSPASASFDQFKNFEERGDFFVSVVKELE